MPEGTLPVEGGVPRPRANSLRSESFEDRVVYCFEQQAYTCELAALEQIQKRRDKAAAGEGGGKLDVPQPAAKVPKKRVLVIASAGDTALALATRSDVAVVDAVDMSHAQIYLCELRRNALEVLEYPEALAFFGVPPQIDVDDYWEEEQADKREELYHKIKANGSLTYDAVKFWDERIADIRFGIHRCGSFHAVLRDVENRAREYIQMDLCRAVINPGAFWTEDNVPGIFRAYSEAFDKAAFHEKTGIPLSQLRDDLGLAYARRVAATFRPLCRDPQSIPGDNMYLTLFFTQRLPAYMAPTGLEHKSEAQVRVEEQLDAWNQQKLPLYLQRTGIAAMRKEGAGKERLRFHFGDLIETAHLLAEKEGPYDLISISNATDYLEKEAAKNALAGLGELLAPGGCIVARRVWGDYAIEMLMKDHLLIDTMFNLRLKKEERSRYCQEAVAWFRPAEGEGPQGKVKTTSAMRWRIGVTKVAALHALTPSPRSAGAAGTLAAPAEKPKSQSMKTVKVPAPPVAVRASASGLPAAGAGAGPGGPARRASTTVAFGQTTAAGGRSKSGPAKAPPPAAASSSSAALAAGITVTPAADWGSASAPAAVNLAAAAGGAPALPSASSAPADPPAAAGEDPVAAAPDNAAKGTADPPAPAPASAPASPALAPAEAPTEPKPSPLLAPAPPPPRRLSDGDASAAAPEPPPRSGSRPAARPSPASRSFRTSQSPSATRPAKPPLPASGSRKDFHPPGAGAPLPPRGSDPGPSTSQASEAAAEGPPPPERSASPDLPAQRPAPRSTGSIPRASAAGARPAAPPSRSGSIRSSVDARSTRPPAAPAGGAPAPRGFGRVAVAPK